MTTSDQLWRRWVQSADLDALGRLFDRTAPGLLQLARYMTGDPTAADDALQSTFVAVLERPRDLGEEGRVEAWLAGILV